MSDNTEITAISAIDGRYASKVSSLNPIVSEFGLIKYRVRVECEWFLFLSEHEQVPELKAVSPEDAQFVRAIAQDFSVADAMSVKAFERTTNHDVKAVEYFVKSKFSERPGLTAHSEWIHFCCTSEDINNTAYALMLKASRDDALVGQMAALIAELNKLAEANADLAMLSRTHGQTASPTTLGKEMKNFAARLQRQLKQFKDVEILGKFNGAVGNFNAHALAYPEIDWQLASGEFLQRLGLALNPWTTQIEPHDYIAEYFHALIRFNQIVLDFDRDIWSYISIEYFKQKKVEGETGSSTMPHKINPIDFENSEGNLGIANALLDHMAQKLAVSRWQRDLSDSTVLRNIGTALAHCAISYQATMRGLTRLEINPQAIGKDLDNSWEVLAEAVQTVMRKHGMAEPYEKLKAVTRGRQMNAAVFSEILTELELPAGALAELKDLLPSTYTGLASKLARQHF
ncbi:MAG: adenylosuccinate lyase [Pseudomonadales bacterium]|nr:adenylosuccinate lyase [Pseudomonadales bacterium]